ncbi:MAG: hypothetical protein GX162_11930 [Firmicutes bacterium]|jgi:predicted aldo/keto reductase-like oxidoreductase|nr:hypothetical protein [Bacillota bacterium]
MAFDELFKDAERLKIRFVAGFDRLHRQGLLSESEFEELVEIIDRLEEFSEEELAERLKRLIRKVEEITGRDRNTD